MVCAGVVDDMETERVEGEDLEGDLVRKGRFVDVLLRCICMVVRSLLGRMNMAKSCCFLVVRRFLSLQSLSVEVSQSAFLNLGVRVLLNGMDLHGTGFGVLILIPHLFQQIVQTRLSLT